MKKIVYTLFISLFCYHAIAQKALLAKAEKEYNNYAYADAIEIYEKLAAKSKLLNKCKDGVKCSEEEHLKSRRSEFVISSM